MQQMLHNGTHTGPRLNTFLSDLQHRVEVLTADIEQEEGRARKFNPADPAYPVLASSLRTRRQNLLATISMLQAAAA